MRTAARNAGYAVRGMGDHVSDVAKRIETSFAAQGLMVTLGARLVAVSEGEVRIELPFAPQLSQQHGYAHAGAITSIVDSACGYAALTRGPPGCEVVSAEFKINFLRPALGQRFLAIGRTASAGRRMAVCTGEVRAFAASATDYKVIALMQATMVYVPVT